jgi:hypothetical protein
LCTEKSAKVYNSRGTYSKSNAAAPNLNYVWEQRRRNGKYSFHINKKHALLAEVKKQLDKNGQDTLSAYLALVENYAPFMQSGLTDAMQKNNSEKDVTSLEYQMEVQELKDYFKLFLSHGFTKEETILTLMDMANYRHLKKEINDIAEEIS